MFAFSSKVYEEMVMMFLSTSSPRLPAASPALKNYPCYPCTFRKILISRWIAQVSGIVAESEDGPFVLGSTNSDIRRCLSFMQDRAA